MAIYNTSSEIGAVLLGMAETTGSLFLGLFVMMLILFALCITFKLPIELTIPVMLPFLIVALTISTSFLPIAGIALLYVAIIVAKNFFI